MSLPINVNLYQNVFFRALDLARGRNNIQRLSFLRQSQFWPKEKLKAWQLDKLNADLEQERQKAQVKLSKQQQEFQLHVKRRKEPYLPKEHRS